MSSFGYKFYDHPAYCVKDVIVYKEIVIALPLLFGHLEKKTNHYHSPSLQRNLGIRERILRDILFDPGALARNTQEGGNTSTT